MLKLGVGTSTHRNPMQAGRDAAQAALKQAGVDSCDFVMMFATVGYELPLLLRAVRDATGRAPLSGCSGEGIIAQNESDESNHAVAVLVWKSDELSFRNVLAEGLKKDSRAVGETLAKELGEIPSDALALYVFTDGLTCNFDQFRQGFEGEARLDRHLPMLGGAAADNWRMTRTYQFHNDRIISDGVAVALLHGQGNLVYGVNHGCVPIGHERTITKCAGNVVYEIDGKPALNVMMEYMEETELRDFARATSNLSLGFKTPLSIVDQYDEFIIRFMPSKDDASGAVTISDQVEPGTKVWMTRRDADKVFRGVEAMGQKVRAQLGNRPPKAVLHFDCSGRGKNMFREQDKMRVLARLQELIGPTVPWIGLYSFGEIAPINNKNFFHNYTVVVSVVY